jgi:hypothetical protein
MTTTLKPAIEEGEEFKSKEQVEEVGAEPTRELEEANLSEEEFDQDLSDETVKLEFAAGLKYKDTIYEGIKGD